MGNYSSLAAWCHSLRPCDWIGPVSLIYNCLSETRSTPAVPGYHLPHGSKSGIFTEIWLFTGHDCIKHVDRSPFSRPAMRSLAGIYESKYPPCIHPPVFRATGHLEVFEYIQQSGRRSHLLVVALAIVSSPNLSLSSIACHDAFSAFNMYFLSFLSPKCVYRRFGRLP